ncbi:MAG: DUF1361 domain-containing protein [Ferruginibacter sp.]
MKHNLSFNNLLAITFVFICLLICSRMVYTGTSQHVFLVWNIFLAWIPYIISNYFRVYEKKQKWKQLFLFSSWLLFFPNALYIITDLIHLQDEGSAPVWFDAILIFTSSFIGLLMAFKSLYNVERYLAKKMSRKMLGLAIPVIIFISSFGVYLGRFGRWNSWDVIHSPLALGENILECFIFPFDHFRSWAITIILSILFYLIYAFSKILPHSFRQNNNAG